MAGKKNRSRSKKSSSFNSPAAVAMATQSELILPSLSTFDPKGEYFAAVIPAADEHRLRIFDTIQNDLPVVATISPSSSSQLESNQESRNYTCLACGLVKSEEGENKKRKKRKSDANAEDSKNLVTSDRLFALGSENGIILIYSLSLGTVLQTLQGGHSYPVQGFAFNSRGNRGISIGGDDVAIEWDLETGKPKRRWNLESKGSMKRVVWSHDESKILTAGHSICLWSEDGKLIKKFPGHVSEVRRIVFSQDDEHAVSIAEQDRTISVWDLNPDNSTVAKVLTCDNSPMEISLSPDNRLLAALEDGTVSLWEDVTQGGKKTRSCDATLRFTNDEDVIPILSATFANSDPLQVLTARGSIVKPYFERVDVLNADTGKLLKEINLERTPSKGIYASNHVSTSSKSTATVVQASVNGTTLDSMEELDHETLTRPGKKSQEPTMEDRLNALILKEDAPKRRGQVKTGNSIHQMLIQAIHSGDRQLLETCFAVHDAEVINNSVKRIPTVQVIPFLNQIIDRFQQKPNRASDMLTWIRAILLHHTPYLLTVPDLVKRLSGLYHTIESRLNSFEKLLKLQGRLDLVMSQIQLRHRQDETDVEYAPVVYNEDEEDDMDTGSEDMEELDYISEEESGEESRESGEPGEESGESGEDSDESE